MAFKMFVFGESLENAIEAIPEEYQLKFYRIIKDYGLHGIEPEELSGFELATWVQMRAMINLTIPKKHNGSPIGKVGAPFGNSNARKGKNNSENNSNNKNNSNQLDELFLENNSENNSNNRPNVNVNDNVYVNENGNENDLSGSAEPPGSKSSSKHKPKKLPIRKREPVNGTEQVEKAYLQNWDTLYSRKSVETPEPIVNWIQTRKLLKKHFAKLKPEQIIQAINNGLKDNFILDGGYSLATMLSASVLNRLINGGQGEAPVLKRQWEKPSLE
jgi:hypothetical protein